MTARALRLRRDRPELFTGYRPVPADGPAAAHAVAFPRSSSLVAVATRLPVGLAARGGWGDTISPLPEAPPTGTTRSPTRAVDGGRTRGLATLLAALPGGAAASDAGVRKDRRVADFAVWAPQRDRVAGARRRRHVHR